jgi:hypothetical protein
VHGASLSVHLSRAVLTGGCSEELAESFCCRRGFGGLS